MYAKDLSRKVKAAKRQRALNGLYISAQVPYGYIKDPNNYNHLVVDDDVADGVRRIYKLYISGLGITEIAKTLEKEKVLTLSYTQREVEIIILHYDIQYISISSH